MGGGAWPPAYPIQRVNDLRRFISPVNANLKEYKNNQKL